MKQAMIRSRKRIGITRAATLLAARFECLRISAKTVWILVELDASDDCRGCGEATLQGQHEAVAAVARRTLPLLMGRDAKPRGLASLGLDESVLAQAALLSALDMALFDLAGQADGVPVHALIGGAQRTQVPLYANINRQTVERTPAGFAASAATACAAGYRTLKIAPFDEIDATSPASDAFDRSLDIGLGRIEATRAAIGADRSLRVDCHWRFSAATAARMIDACVPFAPDWIECPITESVDNAGAVAALRRRANQHDIRLAGLETATGVDGFAPYLRAGSYDVIMPDVKYLGGLERFTSLARLAAECGAVLSPHNPTGPVCHAASVHVAAALPALDSLELQFEETAHFEALVAAPPGTLASDGLAATPTAPGLGVSLEPALVERLRMPASSVSCGGG